MKAAGLTYREAGSGDVPIICLHGIGGNATSFAPQLAGLSSEHRILSVDLPGYGGSELIDLSFEALAHKVADFMTEIGVAKAHLCGQSIGGMIAIETAHRMPDRVASLALIATTSAFGGRDDSFKDAFIAARLKPLDEGQTIGGLAKAFVPEITGPNALREILDAAIATMGAVPEATYRAIIRCLVTFDRRGDVANLPQPACVIAGSEDQNAPPQTMARMAEKMGAEFHEIGGAGHLVNLEAAGETNQILGEFYRRIS